MTKKKITTQKVVQQVTIEQTTRNNIVIGEDMESMFGNDEPSNIKTDISEIVKTLTPNDFISMIDKDPLIKNKVTKIMNQPGFIDYYNKTKGKRMISLPDIYKIGKINDRSLINSIWMDMHSEGIVTSTYYNSKSKEIVHNYGSKYEVSHPQSPCSSTAYTLSDMLKQDKDVQYLKNLFETDDDGETIKGVLVTIFSKIAEDIHIDFLTRCGSCSCAKDGPYILVSKPDEKALIKRGETTGDSRRIPKGYSRGVKLTEVSQ